MIFFQEIFFFSTILAAVSGYRLSHERNYCSFQLNDNKNVIGYEIPLNILDEADRVASSIDEVDYVSIFQGFIV